MSENEVMPDAGAYFVLAVVGFDVSSVVGAVVAMLLGYAVIEVYTEGVKDEWDS